VYKGKIDVKKRPKDVENNNYFDPENCFKKY
jgi:hypothetical protein